LYVWKKKEQKEEEMKDTAKYWMEKYKEERERVGKLRALIRRYEDRMTFLESKGAQKHELCREQVYEIDKLKANIELLHMILRGEFND